MAKPVAKLVRSFGHARLSSEALCDVRYSVLAASIFTMSMVGCGGNENKSQPAPPTAKPTTSISVPETFAPIPDVRTPSGEETESGRPTQDTRVYRRTDDRVVQNLERLTGSQIKRYESRRMILYSDVAPEIAEQLPPLVDALYTELVRFFGELPANKEGTDFQATGYLMRDQRQFRTLGLITDRVPAFQNGRHIGYEFWANDQQDDYYRRHLVLHEFTHCFMACVTGTNDAPPAWYMEGMAEYFGTHRLTSNGPQFGVMPENKKDYKGLGRITHLNQAKLQGDVRSLNDVMSLRAEDGTLYQWSWALCWFLTNQSDLEFDGIGTHHTLNSFQRKLADVVQRDANMLEARWRDFVNQLCDGYDGRRAAVEMKAGVDLKIGESKTVSIAADRNWQSTGIAIDSTGRYVVTASGRYQVDNQPKPWISEPNGVSIWYAKGERLGCLLAAVYSAKDKDSLVKTIRIGEGNTITDREGTLYLRINDTMSSLANNAGSVEVTIRREQ